MANWKSLSNNPINLAAKVLTQETNHKHNDQFQLQNNKKKPSNKHVPGKLHNIIKSRLVSLLISFQFETVHIECMEKQWKLNQHIYETF